MMRSRRPAFLVALVCSTALAMTAGGAEAFPFGRKKPEPVREAPPPPPPAPTLPVIALSGQVMQSASAYRAYLRKASAISAGFTDGTQVESSLELAEASEPLALSRGVVAYAAVLALQEPSFVEGVRVFAKDPVQSRTVADRIAADPAYAAQLAGAPAAAGLIGRVLRADGGRVTATGAAVKQAAYDVQRQKWSKADVPNRPGRLARAKSLAATPMSATPEELAELQAAVPAAPGVSRLVEVSTVPAGDAASPPYTSTVVRGLAVAALAVLGRAGDDNDAAVQTLLNDSAGSFCHNMAKLNLYQCLAVAKPFYEDVFCLGQHILLDTGQCLVKGSGQSFAPATIAAAATTPSATAASALASGSVAQMTKTR